MYSNALEHGLLDMDSPIKNKENGFNEYYEMRQSKLHDLKVAKIILDANRYVEADKGVVSISLEYNGKSFDFTDTIAELVDNKSNNGRGIGLLKDLCRNCKYNDEGRKLYLEYVSQ